MSRAGAMPQKYDNEEEKRVARRKYRKIKRKADQQGIFVRDAATQYLKNQKQYPDIKSGDFVKVHGYCLIYIGEVQYKTGKHFVIRKIGYFKNRTACPPYKKIELGELVKIHQRHLQLVQSFWTEQQLAQENVSFCLQMSKESFAKQYWMGQAWRWALWFYQND